MSCILTETVETKALIVVYIYILYICMLQWHPVLVTEKSGKVFR